MEFKISEEHARAMAQIEEEANCDIGAGFDWGANLGEFLASTNCYIDHRKLLELLSERLEDVLSQEEIEETARSFQEQLRERVVKKYQPPQSA
ncbi:hypothetical protein WA1_39600 [Scytonema hofmannii PCC 7110]|uniref:Uncharacterized protein n=1 Tax=Scytonema hofmannii PCC 7110 TaxID=128403 RepID=A0A139WYP1_9CYAN|nr:hypothetical protein [Scytonema hofmannii]KYC37577.1 hypothetical protein WA1_39600 [Scytonema hofmannii PCC 7110]